MPPKNQNALQAQINTVAKEVISSSTGMTLTLKQIRDMIQGSIIASIASSFSSMGNSGQSFLLAFSALSSPSSSSWSFESGASTI